MSIVSEKWSLSTVLIERQADEGNVSTGTGFFVSRDVGGGRQQTYLVTNKHVLGSQRAFGQELTLKINVRDGERIVPSTVKYSYLEGGIRDHRRADVDVCAVVVTKLFVEVVGIAHITVDYDSMAFAERIRQLDVVVGDDVLSLGYPLGYNQGPNNLPIVRQGILATSLDYDLAGPVAGSPTSLPAFLVDGGVIHGSSGSPIILKPVAARGIGGIIEIGNTLPFLLGILAKTRLATIPDNVEPTYAGLGLAFRAETIRDTVERFYE